jgi:uncharacterized protein YndB with AHSA1/START domain
MVIEETIRIAADLQRVWKTFTDLAYWADWSRTARDVSPANCRMEQGMQIRFHFRPFIFPIYIRPVIKEVVPYERVVWSSSKYGLSSHHEFLFKQADSDVLVISREKLVGLPLVLGGRSFTKKTVRRLTVAMLQDLKNAAEIN